MPGSTKISILPSLLLLVYVPLPTLKDHLAKVIECSWFRDKQDPFFALCVNGVELSIFCDRKIARDVFGPKLDSADEEEERGRSSSVRKLGEKESKKDGIVVGEETWVVLEIEFLDGEVGWANSGARVKELAKPLAEEGISILFISTYQSDFILVTYSRLQDVTRILATSGFEFSSPSDDDEEMERSSKFGDGPRHHEKEGGRERSSSYSTVDLDERRFSTDKGRGGSMSGSFISAGGGDSRGTGASLSRRSSASNRVVATGYRTSTVDPLPPMMSPSPPVRVLSGLSLSQSVPTSPTHPPFPSLTAIQPAPPSPALSPTLPASPLVPSDTETASTPRNVSPSAPQKTTPLPPSPISPRGDSLSILPDELVTVGLNIDPHDAEKLKSKLVQLIFFPDKLLPPPPPPQPPLSDLASMFSRPAFTRKLTSTLPSTSTAASLAPTPFVAFTQTTEGSHCTTSLTADIRLLRAVFSKQEEVEFVHTIGQGGLRGLWDGEVGVDVEALVEEGSEGGKSQEEEKEEEREMESGRTILKCLQLDLVRVGLGQSGLDWVFY